jgi:DNA-binding MurR/RpiR family transcriptional regulator
MIYGKPAVILLNEIASEKPDSANAAIARWLLHQSDPDQLSIKAVADGAHVGIASASRFVKDIGFEDFSSLRDMLKEGLDRPARIDKTKQDSRTMIHDEIVLGLDLASQVDMHAIRQCAKAIDHYQKIWVFGLMKAEAAAICLADDLCLAGKDAATLFSHAQQMDCIKRAGKEELIILFSYTGSYFDISENGQLHINAPVIMISGAQNMYPGLTSLFIRYPSHLDKASHPYTLLYMADLITQTYLEDRH